MGHAADINLDRCVGGNCPVSWTNQDNSWLNTDGVAYYGSGNIPNF